MVTITLLILTIVLAMVICFRNALHCNNNFESGVSLLTFMALLSWLVILIELFNELGEKLYG